MKTPLQHWYSRRSRRTARTLAAVYRVGDGKMDASWAGLTLYRGCRPREAPFVCLGWPSRRPHPILNTNTDPDTGRKWLIPCLEWSRNGAPRRQTDRAAFERPYRRPTVRLQIAGCFPIDAVYTWVDGTDESGSDSRQPRRTTQSGESLIQDALAAARFADHDELRYSLRSIEQYAPWIQRFGLLPTAKFRRGWTWKTPRSRSSRTRNLAFRRGTAKLQFARH